MADAEMTCLVLPFVVICFKHSKSTVRKRAVLTFSRLARVYPLAIQEHWDSFIKTLKDPNPSPCS